MLTQTEQQRMLVMRLVFSKSALTLMRCILPLRRHASNLTGFCPSVALRWRLEDVTRWLATSRGRDIAFDRRGIHAYSGARMKTEPEI